MFCAAVLGSKLIGPFRVPHGVKMTAFTYTEFLERNLIPEAHLLEPGLQDNFEFMHDNAPSHASLMVRVFLRIDNLAGNRLMNWPANSPYLSPTENLWAIVKVKLYEDGKQYNNKMISETRSKLFVPMLNLILFKTLQNQWTSGLLQNSRTREAMSIIRSNFNSFR